MHGNGVPTREILRGIFLLLLGNYPFYPIVVLELTSFDPCTSNHVKTGGQNLQIISALKQISKSKYAPFI